MDFPRGFLAIVAATWTLALLSFLAPAWLSRAASAAGWDHPEAVWLFAPLAGWIGACAAGSIWYRKYAGWLWLSAPMAFFTPVVTAIALAGCGNRLACR